MAERGERIGATVEVAGVPGTGTTVTVRLPAGDVRAPEPWVLADHDRPEAERRSRYAGLDAPRR
jgi:hypothetical protein